MSRGAAGLLAFGVVGWLILFIALVGGCDKTKTVTQTVVTTVVETTTVPADTSTEAIPTDPTTTDSGSPDTSGDSVTLDVLTAHGKVDPVPEIGRVFDFTVDSATDTTLFVKDRSAGGGACAPTEDSDPGAELLVMEVAAGRSHVKQALTWGDVGAYQFCMWLGSSTGDASSRVFSSTITFRQPRGTVSFSSTPSHPSINTATVLRFVGKSEVPRTLFVKERPAGGAACAPTEGTDTGSELVVRDVNGGFNETYPRTFDTAGAYVYCVWLARNTGDTSPIGGVHRFELSVG